MTRRTWGRQTLYVAVIVAQREVAGLGPAAPATLKASGQAMPTPSPGRDSRRGSKQSGQSGNDAYKSTDRREKAKSSQVYDGRRRASKQAESSGSSVPQRPGLKSRTNSAPLVETRDGQSGVHKVDVDGEKPRVGGKSSSTPRIGAVETAQDEDEVAGVVGAVRKFQPFQSPEVCEQYAYGMP